MSLFYSDFWGSARSRAKAAAASGVQRAKKKSGKAKATVSSTASPTTKPAPRNKQPDPLEVVAWFVAHVQARDTPIYLGIDPGATGAIGMLCGKLYAVVDIPVYRVKVKRVRHNNKKIRALTGRKTRTVDGSTSKFDFPAICRLFRLFKPIKKKLIVVLEEIPPTMGKRARKYVEIMVNRAYAIWPLFLCSKGYTVKEIKPSDWKKRMDLYGKDKEASRRLALKIFPMANIQRKEDTDRAEALLIAECVRRIHNGKA